MHIQYHLCTIQLNEFDFFNTICIITYLHIQLDWNALYMCFSKFCLVNATASCAQWVHLGHEKTISYGSPSRLIDPSNDILHHISDYFLYTGPYHISTAMADIPCNRKMQVFHLHRRRNHCCRYRVCPS